jgi:transcriptional regulator EpsA
MKFLPLEPDEHLERYFRIIQEGVAVQSHSDILQWLQGEIQYYVPHEIMLVIWNDTGRKYLRHEVVSALPGVRNTDLQSKDLLTLHRRLYEVWIALGRLPFRLGIGAEDRWFEGCAPLLIFSKAVLEMRSLFVHGISDSYDGTECLYVAFSSAGSSGDATLPAMEYLLPCLDVALRRLGPTDSLISGAHAVEDFPQPVSGYKLSAREVEILNWVKIGKSNAEIGLILKISIHTVKNHIQKILKKLDVGNRIQAALTTGIVQQQPKPQA